MCIVSTHQSKKPKPVAAAAPAPVPVPAVAAPAVAAPVVPATPVRDPAGKKLNINDIRPVPTFIDSRVSYHNVYFLHIITTAAAAEPVVPAAPIRSAAVPAPAAAGMGAEFEANVRNLMDMGFPEAECVAALRAAYMNPARAVEYLMSG